MYRDRRRMASVLKGLYPASKVHEANMGSTWGRQDTCCPHKNKTCYQGMDWVGWKTKFPSVDDIHGKKKLQIHKI